MQDFPNTMYHMPLILDIIWDSDRTNVIIQSFFHQINPMYDQGAAAFRNPIILVNISTYLSLVLTLTDIPQMKWISLFWKCHPLMIVKGSFPDNAHVIFHLCTHIMMCLISWLIKLLCLLSPVDVPTKSHAGWWKTDIQKYSEVFL